MSRPATRRARAPTRGHFIERALTMPSAAEVGPGRQPRRPVPAQLPADVPGFVGRTDELAALDRLLDGDAAAPTCVVSGMPGVGKTALAVRWAHRARSAFPDGQLYVGLRGFDGSGVRREPADVLRGFLETLGVDDPTAADPDLAGLFRGAVADRHLLIVLDDAYDAEQVRPLLPSGGASVVVVTSRDQLPGLIAVDVARPLVLQPCRRARGTRPGDRPGRRRAGRAGNRRGRPDRRTLRQGSRSRWRSSAPARR